MRSKARPRPVLALALGILCAHLVAALFFPSYGSVTCIGLIACYALACYVSVGRAANSSGTMRVRWMLASTGFTLGVVSFCLTLYRQSVLFLPGGLAGIQDVTLLLRSLPFLFAVVLSKRERSPVFVKLDFAQGALAIAVASVAFLFAFPSPTGGYVPVSSLLAIDRLAIANLLVAMAVTVRLFASGASEECRFFRTVCAFLWANAALTTFVNLVAVNRWHVEPGSILLTLGDLPVLGMAVASSLPLPHCNPYYTVTQQDSLIETGSSFIFPFAIFLMAASIVPVHFYLGMGCVALTFLLYALRSTLLQTRYLSAQEQLRTVNDRIRDQALLDGLTGIPNRRSFDLALGREWKRAQRTGQPIALLLLDVDLFKILNDTHGHLTGDACLIQIATVLRDSLGREVDFAARYGGEEFGVLLADTDLMGARTVAEILRHAIERHRFKIKAQAAPTMTVSIGVASFIPPHHDDWEEGEVDPTILIAAADEALYHAKRNGRNRTELHDGSLARLRVRPSVA